MTVGVYVTMKRDRTLREEIEQFKEIYESNLHFERLLGALLFDHESGISAGTRQFQQTRDVLIKHGQSRSASHAKRRPLLFSMIYCFLGTDSAKARAELSPPSA